MRREDREVSGEREKPSGSIKDYNYALQGYYTLVSLIDPFLIQLLSDGLVNSLTVPIILYK